MNNTNSTGSVNNEQHDEQLEDAQLENIEGGKIIAHGWKDIGGITLSLAGQEGED